MFETSATSSSEPSPSFFHHQSKTLFPKLLDNWFNGNKTTTTIQNKPKLLDNWFNGNKTMTTTTIQNKPKSSLSF